MLNINLGESTYIGIFGAAIYIIRMSMIVKEVLKHMSNFLWLCLLIKNLKNSMNISGSEGGAFPQRLKRALKTLIKQSVLLL